MTNKFFEEARQMREAGLTKEALIAFQQAIKLEPENPQIYTSIAHLILCNFSTDIDKLQEGLYAYLKALDLTSRETNKFLSAQNQTSVNPLAVYKGITQIFQKKLELTTVNKPPYKQIVFHAKTAGLCNRLRALSSCLCLSYFLEVPLLMCWYPEEACKCYFEDLYEPVCDIISPELLWNVLDSSDSHKILYINQMVAPAVLHQQFLSKHISYKIFNEKYLEFMRGMKIKPYISNQIEKFTKDNFSNTVVGLHIRRTDFLNHIHLQGLESKFASDEKFIQTVEKEVADGYFNFFLATDNQDTQKLMYDTFPGQIISYCQTFREEEKRQTNVEDALIDLYLLSKCKKIIGSYDSSFSKYAAQLGKVPLIYP